MTVLQRAMAGRRLSPEEAALWRALTRSVIPLRPDPPPSPALVEAGGKVNAPPEAFGPRKPKRAAKPSISLTPQPKARSVPAPTPMLDGSWEKKIRGGQLVPDISVDLHGLNLAAAHARLDRLLGDARLYGWRILHVVTGKPRTMPSAATGEAGRRGAIRAEIGHWLAASSHAGRIASVRTAHPRHGGVGALYIILRRS